MGGQFAARLALAVMGFSLVACEGVIGGPGLDGVANPDSGSPGPSDTGFDAAAVVGSPSESTLVRMTKSQHQATLRTLLERFLGEHADPVIEATAPLYGIVPDDSADLHLAGLVGASFSRMSQVVGELHIRGYFEIANAVAELIAFDEVRRRQLFGDCIDEPAEDHSGCVEAFLDDFGLWVFRRPLTDDERVFLVDTVFADDGSSYQASPEAVRDVLVTLLVAPDFLYFVNDSDVEIDPGVLALDPYELATRLSYHFWESMPDDELFEAAADGRLATPNGYAEQVERVYADPRAQTTLRRFIYEWLELYNAGDPHAGLTSGDVRKELFVDGYEVTPELRDAMVAEVLDMADYYRENGVFEDLFTSNASFAKTPALAAIYDVPAWNGIGPPEPLGNPERVGVLGRAAVLASESVETHPILRGVRVREDFLCDNLGEPPVNLDPGQQLTESVVTTRERVESMTSPASCAGCHTLINGLGFPLEAFDSLGRYRTEEMVIDASGEVAMLPVDVAALPYVDGGSDSTGVVGPRELVDALVASDKLEPCFARHYVRFTLGLLADPAFGGDEDTIDALAQLLRDGVPLGEFYKEVAYLPAFKQRLAEEGS
jgi:hypothetical protein